ncbi:MAG TPA: antibiotic biosynthesis monooxygenase family protein [Burkholderiaceae bacterium]|nr:antibiotic biosynthesis monooxygenase family protein [Burkholderiaceae bacterium]
MILELADIRIHPGKQQEFDAAIVRGVQQAISQAKGFLGYRVQRGIETPERYVLTIYWETLENHTVDFRESAAFQEWRAIVGPYFAAPPAVEHFSLLANSTASKH